MKTLGQRLEIMPWFDEEVTKAANRPEAAIAIPRSIDEISTEWLTQCLARGYPGTVVLSHTAENASQKIGSSSLLRIHVTYNARGREYELPATVIIKGAFGRHGEEFVEMDGVHLNELRFYRDILPTLKTSTLRIFFAGFDPERRQSILIMEDLRDRGARFGTALKPLSYDQSASYVDLLSSLHAQTWDRAEYKEGGKFAWVSPMFDIMAEGNFMKYYFDVYMSEAYWEELDRQPRLAAVSGVFHDRKRLADAFARMRSIIADEEPKCLVHGDSHAGNLYLLPGDEPGWLDWQVKTSSGFVDFGYNIVSSLDIADRRKWEQSLLTRYLAGLKAGGVAAPGFDHAWLRYRQGLVWGLFIWITNDNDFQDPCINAACAARFCAAALDHDTFGLLGV